MSIRWIKPRAGARPAGLLLVAALALIAQAMGPRLLAEAAFGPICSAHGSALHCPSCYAAVALLLAAFAALLAPGFAIAPQRAAARAR